MSDNPKAAEDSLVASLQCWNLPAWTLAFLAYYFDLDAPEPPAIRDSVRAHNLLQLQAALLDLREDPDTLANPAVQAAIRRLSAHVRSVAAAPVCEARR